MAFIRVPAVVYTADDMLPAAWQLIDDETAALEADPDVTVSCAANCNACCEHAVLVTAAETRKITSAISELPEATQELIAARARQILERVTNELVDDAADAASYGSDFARRYYGLQAPCPLLVEGRCSVRSVRPLVCREYLMSSAPEHCFDPTLERAVRVQRRRKVSAGFAAIASRFDESDRRLLPVAILVPVASAVAMPISGPKLARLLST